MKRTTVVAFCAGAVASAVVGGLAVQGAAVAGSDSIDLIGAPYTREPLLIFDTTGGTLTGTVHEHLIVYNDGLASYSAASLVVFPEPGEFIDARTTSLSPDEVEALRVALGKAGASTLVDNNVFIADAPIHTVTFFRKPGTDAIGHSFSFHGGEQHGKVAAIIFALIDEHFPPAPDNPPGG